MPDRKVLHSWEEISNYTGRSIRTIQRYEVKLGFPIHRPEGKSRSAVRAFSYEIDAWFAKAPAIAPVRSVVPLHTVTARQIRERRESLGVAAEAKCGLERVQTIAETCRLQAKRVQEMMDRVEATRFRLQKRRQLNRVA